MVHELLSITFDDLTSFEHFNCLDLNRLYCYILCTPRDYIFVTINLHCSMCFIKPGSKTTIDPLCSLCSRQSIFESWGKMDLYFGSFLSSQFPVDILEAILTSLGRRSNEYIGKLTIYSVAARIVF